MTDSTRSILDVIGNTPMLRLTRVARGEILAKAEFLNPGGSIKDRIALYIPLSTKLLTLNHKF